jgi:type VI secretion system secreted protein VgrG
MTEGARRFEFVSQAPGLSEETFDVVRFRGVEGISRLYEFDITLVSGDPDIDLSAVLQNPATLTILGREGGDDRVIHGIPIEFEQLEEQGEYIFYRALLVPRVWQADLYRENQLFLDKAVPDVIEEILSQTGLTTDDYELSLTGQYPQWEYICQYGETDFDFMSRWMEREGIYYFFEQTDSLEKLIIADNSSRHQNIAGTSTIDFSPPSRQAREAEVVRTFISRQQMLPQRVILRDFNYRRPNLELRGEAEVDSEGRGDVYSYGEHFKTPEEGNALARIRAEEIACRGRVFRGESTVLNFSPGFIFELAGHFRDTLNQRYLITGLETEGDQASAIFGSDQAAAEQTGPTFVNRFACIPADVQFRPERTTPRPRFYGTMNARVDASGDGEYAEIDDEGRYKVRLYFDQSDREDGKASRWVRMSQPYAGADYGMHFPLHKNAEVLLTFVDGDPDRPIIAGSVPNPENASPINSDNQTMCMIKTGGGNQIHTEDKGGSQLMKFQSPTDNTFVRIGAPGQSGSSGIQTGTDGHQETKIAQKRSLEVGGDAKHEFKANVEDKTMGDHKSTTIGSTTQDRIGDSKTTNVGNREILDIAGLKLTAVGQSEQTAVAGERALYVGSLDITGIAGNTSIWVGTKSQITIAASSEIYVGGKSEVFVGAKSSIAVGGATEIFVGLKTAINVAGSMEIYVGIKMEIKVGGFMELVLAVKMGITLGACIDLHAGPRVTNEPSGEIKTESFSLTTGGVRNSIAALTNML